MAVGRTLAYVLGSLMRLRGTTASVSEGTSVPYSLATAAIDYTLRGLASMETAWYSSASAREGHPFALPALRKFRGTEEKAKTYYAADDDREALWVEALRVDGFDPRTEMRVETASRSYKYRRNGAARSKLEIALTVVAYYKLETTCVATAVDRAKHTRTPDGSYSRSSTLVQSARALERVGEEVVGLATDVVELLSLEPAPRWEGMEGAYTDPCSKSAP